MKSKILLFLFTLCLLTGCSSKEPDALDQQVQQIEQAISGEYSKTSQTEVYEFPLNNDSGDEILYYICLTTYEEEVPQSTNGVNIEAISAVFDAAKITNHKEFDVEGHPAAIYYGEDYTYLCWTSTPEASAVMQYAPGTISEADAMRIVESVYKNPNP